MRLNNAGISTRVFPLKESPSNEPGCTKQTALLSWVSIITILVVSVRILNFRVFSPHDAQMTASKRSRMLKKKTHLVNFFNSKQFLNKESYFCEYLLVYEAKLSDLNFRCFHWFPCPSAAHKIRAYVNMRVRF